MGNFDGTTFTSSQTTHKWVDHGTDNYAGITYNGTPNGERVFIGWMSNWEYARHTPTEKWRSAMTLPRKMGLIKMGEGYDLASYPLKSFDALLLPTNKEQLQIPPKGNKTLAFDHFNRSEVVFHTASKDFGLRFKNGSGEELRMDMDGKDQKFLLDRSASGKTDFHASFGKEQVMSVPSLPNRGYEVRLIMDWSSVEIFINKGQYVMTAQVFPTEFYNNLEIVNPLEKSLELSDFRISEVKSSW